jgi:hypothetical protein
MIRALDVGVDPNQALEFRASLPLGKERSAAGPALAPDGCNRS